MPPEETAVMLPPPCGHFSKINDISACAFGCDGSRSTLHRRNPKNNDVSFAVPFEEEDHRVLHELKEQQRHQRLQRRNLYRKLLLEISFDIFVFSLVVG